ncbi:hypothetical protein LCGC14_3052630 [marine sediment metagenome]|uniref:Uncharacterized protein n=1 Tax=marine sediment metagenome TaxID=412755 RepID=A0A0F8YU43_9ZZZZ
MDKRKELDLIARTAKELEKIFQAAVDKAVEEHVRAGRI